MAQDCQVLKDQFNNTIICERNIGGLDYYFIVLPMGDNDKRKTFNSWDSAKKYLNSFFPRKRLKFEEI